LFASAREREFGVAVMGRLVLAAAGWPALKCALALSFLLFSFLFGQGCVEMDFIVLSTIQDAIFLFLLIGHSI
jgi:hypothetical protein